MLRKLIAPALLVGLCCSASRAVPNNLQPDEPAYEFKLRKPADSVVVAKDKERTTFAITSESGIGDATLRLAKGDWPKHVSVRFHYTKARGFTKLEGFDLTTANLNVSSMANGPGEHKMPFWFAGLGGKFDPKAPHAGTLTVAAEKKNGALELSLPANLLVGSKEFKITWVDAYRN